MTLAESIPTPILARTPRADVVSNRLPLAGRVGAGAVATFCLAVLLTAFFLKPADTGHGTHTRLGLPACGWAVFFGRPCPTCGMTTSFAHASKGHFIEAAKTQPAGFLLSLGCAGTFWAAMHGAVFASRVDRLVAPLVRPACLWTGAGIIGAAWAYKMATWTG